MKKISVCIPTYNMYGEGVNFLRRNLDALTRQSFKDFEVVITDNSDNDVIEKLCKEYDGILDIKYYVNPRKGMAQNTNESIQKAQGEIIKILYMDDYLASNESLKDIANNFKNNWLITACAHDTGDGKIIKTHLAKYNKRIVFDKNTIGSPSVVAIKNNNPLLFDESLKWLLDCEYYKRVHDKYGNPDILENVNVIIGISKDQTTSHLGSKLKLKEANYLAKKYSSGLWQYYNIGINMLKYLIREIKNNVNIFMNLPEKTL